jgi:hypothetical protein
VSQRTQSGSARKNDERDDVSNRSSEDRPAKLSRLRRAGAAGTDRAKCNFAFPMCRAPTSQAGMEAMRSCVGRANNTAGCPGAAWLTAASLPAPEGQPEGWARRSSKFFLARACLWDRRCSVGHPRRAHAFGTLPRTRCSSVTGQVQDQLSPALSDQPHGFRPRLLSRRQLYADVTVSVAASVLNVMLCIWVYAHRAYSNVEFKTDDPAPLMNVGRSKH